jgi:glutamyl/glutaminyl-tRNA synthetase
MSNQKLADILFSEDIKPVQYWFDKYPARQLATLNEVTRLCPSPTGFLHLGALYMGVINQRIASDTDGIFYLRIEDTDTDREVSGARALIVEGLAEFGIKFHEGFLDGENQFGEYGPYLQTQRADIYASFARELVLKGRAYPCFITKEELDIQRKKQEEEKVRPGYYGKYAVWRDASIDKIQEKLASGTPYVLRFRSIGDQNVKRPFTDEFLGDIQVPQNDEDFVLLKTNRIPTYHLAHIVDDYLMGTTFVIRATEWLPSVGKHLELWDAFNFKVPKYGHLAPINKKEGSTVRKLSKRKDPEANIMRYIELGYPAEALVGYLYRLANPSFDNWWQSGRRTSVWDFPFMLNELQKSGPGPLIDLKKLDDISSDIIAVMSAEEVADRMIEWASKYDTSFAKLISSERPYLVSILNIERDFNNPRKDIITWSIGKGSILYFFDSVFDIKQTKQALADAKLDIVGRGISKELIDKISAEQYFSSDSLELWLSDIRGLAEHLGFALDKNKLKETPEQFKGDFADFMKIIRLTITGTNRTPNLFYVLKVMGRDRVINRIKSVLN